MTLKNVKLKGSSRSLPIPLMLLFVCVKLLTKILSHETVGDMLFQQANIDSVLTPEPRDAGLLLVINAVVTPQSCTR